MEGILNMLIKNLANMQHGAWRDLDRDTRLLTAKIMLDNPFTCIAKMRVDACAGYYDEIVQIFGGELNRDLPVNEISAYHSILFTGCRRMHWDEYDSEYGYQVDFDLPCDSHYNRMHHLTNWEYARYKVDEYFKALHFMKLYTKDSYELDLHSKKIKSAAIRNSTFYKQALDQEELSNDNALSFNASVLCILLDMICLGMYIQLDGQHTRKRKRNRKVVKAWEYHGYLSDQMHKYFNANKCSYVKYENNPNVPLRIEMPQYVIEFLYEYHKWDDEYVDFPDTFMYIKQTDSLIPHDSYCPQADAEYGWYHNHGSDHDLIWSCSGCGSRDRFEYEIVYGRKKTRKVVRGNITSDERVKVYNRDGLECQQCGIVCKPSERELGHILSLYDAEMLDMSDWEYLNTSRNLMSTCMSCNASQGRKSMSPKFYENWIRTQFHRPMIVAENELYRYLIDAENLY